MKKIKIDFDYQNASKMLLLLIIFLKTSNQLLSKLADNQKTYVREASK